MYEKVLSLFEEQGFTDVKVEEKTDVCTVTGYAPGRVTKWPLDRTIAMKNKLKAAFPDAREVGADYKPVGDDYRVKFTVSVPVLVKEQEIRLSA